MTSPSALICGVTSSAMPEKNGVSWIWLLVFVAVPVVVWLPMLVTKYSSLPTLITAFWLLTAVVRGLDSTCVRPWVCSNSMKASKSVVSMPMPNTPPKPSASRFGSGLPEVVGMVRPASGLVLSLNRSRPRRTPPVIVRVPSRPIAAQLMPDS